jgi:hypothetical protein
LCIFLYGLILLIRRDHVLIDLGICRIDLYISEKCKEKGLLFCDFCRFFSKNGK